MFCLDWSSKPKRGGPFSIYSGQGFQVPIPGFVKKPGSSKKLFPGFIFWFIAHYIIIP